MKEYKELRVEYPFKLTEELNKAAEEGWTPVCALSVGVGYLLEREAEA